MPKVEVPSVWSAYSTELKLISIVAVWGLVFWSAWSWRGSRAEQEKAEAVATATNTLIDEVKKKVETEGEERKEALGKIDASLRSLRGELKSIRSTQEDVALGVTQERERNKAFYDQPVPDGGRKQWLKARKAAEAASEPASSASR